MNIAFQNRFASDGGIDTYFASPERATKSRLEHDIASVSENPVLAGVLHSVGGLIAVLNGNRQIVAVNYSFLSMLGIDDAAEALGLRPGEALHCIHAQEGPAGCGTTQFCATCGAAIAIVASQGQNRPMERLCALSAHRNGKHVDMALRVRSQPIELENNQFLLLFMKDVTEEQQRAALERTFFHDIKNMLGGIVGASELLMLKNPTRLAETINNSAIRIHKEIEIQRCLLQNKTYQPIWYDYSIRQILCELETFFENHAVGKEKLFHVVEPTSDVRIHTDISLVLRVLCNMVMNALEATEQGGAVNVWATHGNDKVVFHVWNAQAMPEPVTRRIFQRNFSTKEESGRGLGTYSMKLFGETLLGGEVGFVTSEEEGTTFRFALPV